MCQKCFAKSDWHSINPYHLKNTISTCQTPNFPLVYSVKKNKGHIFFMFFLSRFSKQSPF